MERIETFSLPQTRFLSNFYPYKNSKGDKYPEAVHVEYEGITFDCTENAYQAAKTTDMNLRQKISRMTPFESKAYWVERESEIRPDWYAIRDNVMREINQQKFQNNPVLRQRLLDTGNAELIEGNTWGDTYWGVCEKVGQNRLGQILQQIRQHLREQTR